MANSELAPAYQTRLDALQDENAQNRLDAEGKAELESLLARVDQRQRSHLPYLDPLNAFDLIQLVQQAWNGVDLSILCDPIRLVRIGGQD
ncbi:MAG TPA: hypothetical protein PLY87_08925 [Planctomycetaceae bacterium]|nr:hypothetical protein [Planctomycetaceae bacterium]HQZ65185.1 hypothetical protein [Planctomycetaceae bacterium]